LTSLETTSGTTNEKLACARSVRLVGRMRKRARASSFRDAGSIYSRHSETNADKACPSVPSAPSSLGAPQTRAAAKNLRNSCQARMCIPVVADDPRNSHSPGKKCRGSREEMRKCISAEVVGSRSRRAYFSTAIIIITVVYQHFSAF